MREIRPRGWQRFIFQWCCATAHANFQRQVPRLRGCIRSSHSDSPLPAPHNTATESAARAACPYSNSITGRLPCSDLVIPESAAKKRCAPALPSLSGTMHPARLQTHTHTHTHSNEHTHTHTPPGCAAGSALPSQRSRSPAWRTWGQCTECPHQHLAATQTQGAGSSTSDTDTFLSGVSQ